MILPVDQKGAKITNDKSKQKLHHKQTIEEEAKVVGLCFGDDYRLGRSSSHASRIGRRVGSLVVLWSLRG